MRLLSRGALGIIKMGVAARLFPYRQLKPPFVGCVFRAHCRSLGARERGLQYLNA